MLNSNLDIYKKIEIFVETYIDLLKKNPYIPGFVINEINRNPDRLLNLINLQGIDFALLGMQIAHETKRKKIKPIDIRHIMVNIIGMCIFPFIGRPILQNFLFQNNQEEYDKFIEERKKIIPQFVINSLK